MADLSFNDLLRAAADAGLMPDAMRWRDWREMRNATSQAYDTRVRVFGSRATGLARPFSDLDCCSFSRRA